MPRPTKEQLQATEEGLTNWWCGANFGNHENTTEGIRATKLLSQYEDMTIELLTLWRGYLDANQETGVQPSVEDFVLATYVINKMEATNG